MARTTRKNVEGIFSVLAKMMGKQIGCEPGNWQLDYQPDYGGYVICETLSTGGETKPLGHSRRTAGDMWDTMHFAIRLLEYRDEKR